MADAPWLVSDNTLDADGVAAVLAAQPGATGLDAIRYHSEGWDSRVFTARGTRRSRWILRFPKRANVAARLETEIRLLPALAPRLPLPIPGFELVGEPAAGFPHRFVGYPMLPGTPGDVWETPIGRPAELGRALGEFLAALHSVPLDLAQAAGVSRDDGDINDGWDSDTAAGYYRQYGEGLPGLAESLALVANVPGQVLTAALMHNDFFPEHTLLTADGLAAGVIDFGDVAIDDPAGDVAGLRYWGSEELFEAGLDAYVGARGLDGAVRAALAQHALVVCAFRASEDLDYGAREGGPAYTRLATRFMESLAR